MRILLIEDDRQQKELLVKTIEKSYADVKVYDAETIKEASKILEDRTIDLFLIDINLPDGSGLEFAKGIREIPQYKLTGIVFLTTQVVQIIDAFKNTHCYDFLIKPYTDDDIKRIIDVFYEKNKFNNSKEGNYFVVLLENGVYAKIYEEDIVFAQYSHRLCTIYTTKGVINTKNITLSKLLKKMKSDKILQSHKSYVVNTRYIEKIERIYPKIYEVYFTSISETALLSNSFKEPVFQMWEE